MNLTQQTYIPCTLLELEDGVINARKCYSLGNHVVVHPPGRDCILEELYTGHPRIAHMKKIARMFVWWPHMDSNIETYVKSCSECQSQCPAPSASLIHPWIWQ